MLPIFTYRKLYPSLKEHRLVEERVRHLLHKTLDERYIAQRKAARFDLLSYAKRNFFSILFLSIYRAIGISEERRLNYGIINHSLRGIVTGADNLLDDEYKELLPLDFPERATRFKSIMHILLFDRFLAKTVRLMEEAGSITREEAEKVQDALFRAIVPIGANEAVEEEGIDTIISPEAILSSVHMYKGGKLLCLSFVAPRILEKSFSGPLSLAEDGVYSIGLALQIIDDLTDFYQDIAAGNHNYLVSSIAYRGTTKERKQLDEVRAAKAVSGPAIERTYPTTVREVMAEAIGEALYGFSLLEESGYWCNRIQAHSLIRQLFILRGVKQLLPFFPEEPVSIHLPHHATV